MPSAVAARSTSGNTSSGALPPSSRWVRLRSAAATVATSMPARVDPVIETRSVIGCLTRARPVSRSPVRTVKAPSGRNSAAISASRTAVDGVVSAGLSTTVLPAARAGAIFQTAIISG